MWLDKKTVRALRIACGIADALLFIKKIFTKEFMLDLLFVAVMAALLTVLLVMPI